MRAAVRSAALIAFSVACGYAKLILFPYLFFVELFSMAVFLSGVIAGAAWGMWIGAAARLVFSVANPYGPPHPWVLAAQIVGAALLGALGGSARGLLLREGARRRAVLLAIAGLMGTAAYDLLTNAAQGVAFGAVRATLAAAAIPALQHVASNAVLFAIIGSVAIPWVARAGRMTVAAAVMLAAGSAGAPGAAAQSTQPEIGARGAAFAASDSAVARAGRDTLGLAVPVDALRKRGDASLAELLRGRRAYHFATLPVPGPETAAIAVPDAGSRVLPRPHGTIADHATDRSVAAGFPIFLGVPDLAAAWSGPDADGVDPFDIAVMEETLEPGVLRGAGELLARPASTSFAAAAFADDPGARRVRSALHYRNGDREALDTGARFASPLLLRGVAASFTRRTSGAHEPFLESFAKRTTATAGLPRLGPVAGWVEGRLFQKRLDLDVPGGYLPGTTHHARAEWAGRDLSLHARAAGEAVQAVGSVRVGRATRTQIGYANERERWSFPEAAAAAGVSVGRGAWSLLLSGEGSRRRPTFRVDSVPEFSPRVHAGRASAGLRWSRSGSAGVSPAPREYGVGADAALDVREGDRALLDARLSLWAAGGRGRFRLDVESAHERPTHVDLLTPERTSVVFGQPLLPKLVAYRRSGNPALRERRLRGALATASLSPARRLELTASGSIRHVVRDFGWNLARSENADTIFVTDVASARGDGWVGYVAGGAAGVFGPVRARALAWGRRAPGGLSPQGGSPPRFGFDGGADLRVVLFGGDLPLEAGLEAHGTGPRRGAIRAPASVLWQGSLRADFGPAAVFARVTNIFDARVPSALYEIATDEGVPVPPRMFHFGAVWYLLD